MVFSTDIVANPSSEQFQKNFDENSDVITIMKTLLDAMSLHKSFKATLQNYGFQDKTASQVINTIQLIMQNFDKDTDPNNLWDQLISLYKTMDMMQFIQSIIEEIGKTRPEWIKCRVASYRTVINVLNKYALVYKGDTSLSYDGKLSFIEVSQRPGAKGFTCPGSCFVLQIGQNIDMKKNFGSVVHRDLSRKETEHPIAILTDLFLNNIFTIPLIEGYVQFGGMYEPFHKRFYKTQPSNLLICYIAISR